MRKKIKRIVLVIVIFLVGLIVFAPVPIPHFTNFTSVCDVDGQEVDVTIKVRFVHFKPLFFRYYEGLPLGTIKIYDNATKEEICDLKFNSRYISSYSEGTYITQFFEPNRKTVDKIKYEVTALTTYNGWFIWDDSFDNVVVAFSEELWDVKENPDTYETTREFFTYLSSKKDLTTDELVDLFYDYRGIFMPDSELE